MSDANAQITQIGAQIRSMDARQEKRIEALMREDPRRVTIGKLDPLIQTQICTHLAAQVAAQIGTHPPVSLRAQIDESRRELRRVSACWRIPNLSALRMPRDEYEPLSVVCKADGERSAHFPANYRSLWSYDLKAAKALARDYQLPTTGMREVNLNNFMAHSIPFHPTSSCPGSFENGPIGMHSMPASAYIVVMPVRRR